MSARAINKNCLDLMTCNWRFVAAIEILVFKCDLNVIYEAILGQDIVIQNENWITKKCPKFRYELLKSVNTNFKIRFRGAIWF